MFRNAEGGANENRFACRRTAADDRGVDKGDDRRRACERLSIALRSVPSVFSGMSRFPESFLEWHYLIETMYCAKGGLSLDQVRDVFLKYSQQHPQRLRERASTLLFTALSEALPCK